MTDWPLDHGRLLAYFRPMSDAANPSPETPETITALFTGANGQFLCARWGRPVAPVIFGLADETLAIFRGALQAALAHAGHPMAETDPESGANWLCFALRSWDELAGLPDLDRMTGLADLPARLAGQGAASYRLFRFDRAGAIRACFTFLNLGGALGAAHPGRLAESTAMASLLSWAGDITPSPTLAALIRAAYDPVLPDRATDPAHALRLAARLAAAPLAAMPANP